MIGRKKKALRGMELISEVTGHFIGMIDDLENGIKDCQEEKENVNTQIAQLTNRSRALDTAADRAKSIAKNLDALIGG